MAITGIPFVTLISRGPKALDRLRLLKMSFSENRALGGRISERDP
jgi:hypothetical protein